MKIKNLTCPDKLGKLKIEKKGFSLIELVFSVFFLTVIIFGVVSLQSSNLAMLNRENNQILAHFYASQGVAIAKSLGFDPVIYNTCKAEPAKKLQKKLSFDDIQAEYSLADLNGANEEVTSTIFERYIEVDCNGLSDAYKVTALIEWEDATGPHRKEQIIDGQLQKVNAHTEAKRIVF